MMQKTRLYEQVIEKLKPLVSDEDDLLCNCANAAALLYRMLPSINWVGVYFLRHGVLYLGPFQGKPACTRIPLGRGICGRAAEQRQAIVVEDVNSFPGHIVCDAGSRSELVVPLVCNSQLWGVLDVDSPEPNRFDEADRHGLQGVAALLCSASRLHGDPLVIPE